MRYVLIAIFVTTLLYPALPVRAADPEPIYLVGPGGDGGTVGVDTSLASTGSHGIGNSTERRATELFLPYAGTLSSLQIKLGANTGTPTGDITWEITDDAGGYPGSVLQSGTFTPTPNALNIVPVSSGIFLDGTTFYWLVLRPTSAQTVGNQYNVSSNNTDPYANGYLIISTTAGASWVLTPGQDMIAKVITGAGELPEEERRTALAQSFTVGVSTDVSSISLYMLKVNSPTGILTLEIQSDAGNSPSGFAIADGATANEADLDTDYSYLEFAFDTPITLDPFVKYWLVLTTDRTDPTDYVGWGTSATCTDIELKALINSFWSAELITGLFSVGVDSISTNDTAQYLSLSSGQQASIDYRLTAGDAAIASTNFIQIGIMLLMAFMLMLIARRVKP